MFLNKKAKSEHWWLRKSQLHARLTEGRGDSNFIQAKNHDKTQCYTSQEVIKACESTMKGVPWERGTIQIQDLWGGQRGVRSLARKGLILQYRRRFY